MQAIGFFDSGIGGLTVLQEALKTLPREHYLYFADTENAPYGTKPKETVRELVFEAIDCMAKQPLKAVVVACNTATSVVIEDLRKKYEFPIIGMEPAVKPAVALARPKRVLVFATELTLREEKLKNLVARVEAEELVDYLPLQELVMFAENFEFDEARIVPYLKNKFAHTDLDRYGAVVLGCTHFLFFKNILRKVLPPYIRIVDGNVGTINNLRNKLDGNFAAGPGSVSCLISGKPAEKAYFERYLAFYGAL